VSFKHKSWQFFFVLVEFYKKIAQKVMKKQNKGKSLEAMENHPN